MSTKETFFNVAGFLDLNRIANSIGTPEFMKSYQS